MKKALFAIVFSLFLPTLAMAGGHRSSFGVSIGFGGGYCRGYDYGCYPAPVYSFSYAPAYSYYPSYSYYPAYSYTTYSYAAPAYVAPAPVYVEPAPRVYIESRYRDYGRYYDSDRCYRRY